MLRLIARLIAFGWIATLAGAQQVLYQTDFNDDSGWTLAGCWAVDDLPVLPNGTGYTGPKSLNCNDANGGYPNCYDDFAVSPVIDLGAVSGLAQLEYWCRWDTEEGNECQYDEKSLWVTDANSQAVLLSECFTWTGSCWLFGQNWHPHSVSLDPAWGQVRVSFYFDVHDQIQNAGTGWFIDDLQVTGGCGLPTQTYCSAKVNSVGCLPNISAAGDASWSGSGTPFSILAHNVINQHPGLLIWSELPQNIPYAGGKLCVGPLIRRTAVQQSGGSSLPPADCTGTYNFAFSPQVMAAGGLGPNSIVYAQYWSRDTGFAAPDNVGLTQGLRFHICP